MHKALWLLPPLLGVAFYAGGSMLNDPAAAAAGRTGRLTESAAVRGIVAGMRLVPEGASGEEMVETLDRVAKADKARLGSYGVAELEQAVLNLRDRRERAADAPEAEREDLEMLYSDALIRLGKQAGDAGLAWLMEHAPEEGGVYRRDWAAAGERAWYMHGWAEADPAGAFEALVRSEVKAPCGVETLAGLLQSFASQGPEALREACRRVPWALFPIPYVQELRGRDVRPWIDSGILPELQRRGVSCESVLRQWAEEYPREVLAQWRAGSELIAAYPDLLTRMLKPSGSGSAEQERATATALSELPEEDRERLLRLAGYSPGDPEYAIGMDQDFDPDRARKFFSIEFP